ncbi:hypothetical protein [Bacillus cereus]|uniref:hypothetical protein n=1 Tax=Bacillus cereus TaxID=1396 RepID=UPI00159B94FF|nr:hypothetical protein [Bacillus cereus]
MVWSWRQVGYWLHRALMELIQVMMITLEMKKVETLKEKQVMMDIFLMKKGLIIKILELPIQTRKNRVVSLKKSTEKNKRKMMRTFIEGMAAIDIRWRKLMIF